MWHPTCVTSTPPLTPIAHKCTHRRPRQSIHMHRMQRPRSLECHCLCLLDIHDHCALPGAIYNTSHPAPHLRSAHGMSDHINVECARNVLPVHFIPEYIAKRAWSRLRSPAAWVNVLTISHQRLLLTGRDTGCIVRITRGILYLG